MSQAQALLDCVADLVAHCGVPGAVAVLQEGLRLRQGPSWAPGHHSPDSWRILGQSPSPDGAGDHLSSAAVAEQLGAQCGVLARNLHSRFSAEDNGIPTD